jgi:hypothetical protein
MTKSLALRVCSTSQSFHRTLRASNAKTFGNRTVPWKDSRRTPFVVKKWNSRAWALVETATCVIKLLQESGMTRHTEGTIIKHTSTAAPEKATATSEQTTPTYRSSMLSSVDDLRYQSEALSVSRQMAKKLDGTLTIHVDGALATPQSCKKFGLFALTGNNKHLLERMDQFPPPPLEILYISSNDRRHGGSQIRGTPSGRRLSDFRRFRAACPPSQRVRRRWH